MRACPHLRARAAALVLSALLATPLAAVAGIPERAVPERPAAPPSLQGGRAAPEPAIAARFDPDARLTRVTAAAPGLCVALDLPLAWTLAEAEAPATVRLAPALGGPAPDLALDLALLAARTLPPVPTLASRDGALPAGADDLPRRAALALQRAHERTLGRPAGSSTLTPLDGGALRWTATWLDPSLPAPLTLDTMLLPLARDWVLALTLSGAETQAMHEGIVGEVVERTRVSGGC